MQPIYIHGTYPSKIKIITNIISLFLLPILIAYWMEYACFTYSNTNTEIPFIILYSIAFLVTFVILTNSSKRTVYLFYNSFLLYKERLSMKDKIVLAFMNKDLEKLEKYLDKYQYRVIDTLSINYHIENMTKFSESGISIYIDINYTNGHKQRLIPTATKEDYRQLLDPFLQYQIPIIDPHHIVDAIYQDELRIIDYLEVNKYPPA